ncbi:MAG: aldo/keto reductase [Chitinophagaceae bacterium]|nr:aldo/keto reductase [Chitinophagaceae bacterium]
MKYVHLGKSTLQISRIGFGCMSLKGSFTEMEKLIHRAIEGGINYFDTADLYDKGLNEKTVGKAIAHKRSEIVLATKVGNQWRNDGSGWDWNPTKQYILTAVEASLKRLQTDYIDLYQLHGGTIDDPIDETIEAFELLKKQGKIRFYGISSIRPNVIKEYVRKSNISSVMLQYSLLDRRAEENIFPLLMEHKIGVLARGTVAGGLLVDKPAKDYLNYAANQVGDTATSMQLLSGESRSAAQTSIQFVLHQPALAAAVVGIRTHDQLTEALNTLTAPLLSEREIDTLNQSVKVNYYTDHR